MIRFLRDAVLLGLVGVVGLLAPAGTSCTPFGAAADQAADGGANDGGANDGSVPDGGAVSGLALTKGDVVVAYALASGAIQLRGHHASRWTDPVEVSRAASALGSGAFVVPRFARSDLLVAAQTVAGANVKHEVFTFDGAKWETAFSSQKLLAQAATARGIDLEMESVSGDVLAVYADGTKIPKFRTRAQGGAWSAEASVFPSVVGGEVRWIDLVPSPTSDEITLLFSDANQNLAAAVWNGSTWSSRIVLDPLMAEADYLTFGAAYESTSGNMLAMWNRNGDTVEVATRAPGSNTFSVITGLENTFPVGPLALSAQVGSNRIAAAYLEDAPSCNKADCNDFVVAVWTDAKKFDSPDGLVTSRDFDVLTSYGTRRGSMPAAVAWMPGTDRAVAVYHKASPSFRYATYEPSGRWSDATDAQTVTPLGDKASFAFAPDGSALLLFVADTAGALWAKRFDGTAWSDADGGIAVATGLASASAPSSTAVYGVPFGVTVVP